jgi:hypothetical protein
MNDIMGILLAGALAMACALAGLVFLRFWKSSRDSFFLYFAVSFWLQGAQWVQSGLMGSSASEDLPYSYLLRLLAYALIAFAILRKNMGRKAGAPRSPDR